MKNFLPLLCSTSLFNGLTPEELQTLLAQLGAVMRSYGKGEALVLAGEPNRRVGIVLSGELQGGQTFVQLLEKVLPVFAHGETVRPWRKRGVHHTDPFESLPFDKV